MGKKLIVKNNPKSPISEAFRNMRTNIYFSNIDNTIKSIVLTSSMKSEGKSTIISNYAITLAQTGKRVLLIDSDLRRPSLHKIFDKPNTKGLINVLMKEITWEETV